MRMRKKTDSVTAEEFNQALAKLRSLYTINSELTSTKNSTLTTAVSKILTLYMGSQTRNQWSRILCKFYYDDYLDQLNRATDPQQKNALMLNIANILAGFIGKDNASRLSGNEPLSAMSSTNLLNLIGKYWEISKKKLRLKDSTPSLAILHAWIIPSHLESLINICSAATEPMATMFITSLIESNSSDKLKERIQREITNRLTYQEIIKKCEALKLKNDHLRASIDKLHMINKVVCVYLVLPLAIYIYLTQPEFALDVAMIAISMLIPLGLDYYKSMIRSQETQTLNKKISTAEKHLKNHIPADLIVNKNYHCGESLQSSYINFNFGEFEDISASKVCRIVKNILLNHGLPIADCNRSSLSIRADFSLSAYASNAIKDDINQAIKQFQKTYRLTQQLKEICNKFDFPGLTIPQSTHSGLARVKFFMEIPSQDELFDKTFIDELMMKLQKLFLGNTVQSNGNYLSFEGYTPCSRQQLDNFFADYKTLLDAIQEQKIPVYEKNTSANFFRNNRSRATSKKIENEREQLSHQQKDGLPKLKERENKLGEINPLTGRCLPDCFFTLFAMKREDFGSYAGTKEKPGSYDKFATMATDSKLANGRKGATGFIFIDRKERDVDGKLFHAKGMWKAKGEHGDERVFCSEENIQGKQVYVARGFDPKAH